MAAVRVEIVSDLVCPWCYIGKRRFDRAVYDLRHSGVELTLDVHWRAFQLDPTAPFDSPEPVIEGYARKFGGYQRAGEILSHVTTTAAAEDITFDMQNAVRANTLHAHRLIAFVAQHQPELQGSVYESVMAGYFSEGLDIGDPRVLMNCAQRAGFVHTDLDGIMTDRTTVADEWSARVHNDIAWAAERDITAVPTFVINDAFVIPGAQDASTFARLLGKMHSQS